ncbi:multidrug ABC transporter ATPase [Saccharothrix sp. NRRL B-16348]|uniref:ABC transporter ATP-binding protein n=1 Tax=Saccharothrix sp. NRRL B-16348 TaxID=1415542 RepID=UPI0006AFC2D9|nr:ABC transporter ATP-binding protein [Saccharothrix sp. NRRL B-16348]KOX30109.1 multidrug ABC transporter ATPase [Saccharothrix sp. NRRL B-16348]
MSRHSDELPPALRSLWRSLKFGYRVEPKFLVLSCGLTICGVIPDVAVVFALKVLADGVARGDRTLAYTACLAVGALTVAIWLLSVGSGRAVQGFADRITVALESHVAHLQAAAPGLAHHERPEYLDRLAVLRNQVFALNHLYGSLFSTAASVVRVALTLALLVSVHPVLALLGLAALPGVAVSGWRAEKVRTAQERAAQHGRRARHLFVLATTAGPAKELRVAGLGDVVRTRQREARERWYRAVSAMRWRGAAWQSATWLLFGLTYGAALWYVAVALNAPAGDVVIVLVAGSRVSQYVADLVAEANFLRGDWLGASRRLAWLEDYAADQQRDQGSGTPPERLRTGIRFEGVSFTYPGTDREVLRDVDLTLPAGTTVAVVGENGAGKTTLIKLLCRFYEPTSGRITVDGDDLAGYHARAWRERITGTFQDFFRFEFTAKRSVGVGDLPSADDAAAVWPAIDRAGARGVVDGLPAGLDTRLGATWDGGVDLSFGQWQKIGVARGSMRTDALVRVLDEPTSALDAETEHELFERYAEEAASDSRHRTGAITVLVSHRFSTVRMADLIIVLNGAAVHEVGSHEELMARGGTYAELYSLQARSYH